MKLTNTYGLPEAMVRVISQNEREREGYSITDIDSSPRQLQLIRRHWKEIETDVAERLWALLGTSVHYILEKGATPSSLTEEALTMKVDGIDIKGHSDLWKDKCIEDYKVTSAWTIIYNPKGRREWHSQLNMYIPLWQSYGFPVGKLKIWAILRDWQKSKALYNYGYPKIPFVGIDIPIWDIDTIMAYIRLRLAIHETSVALPDEALPLCTPAEMWEKPTIYAVHKEGRKSALKLCDTPKEADDYMLNNTGKLHVQERPGCRIKCDDYCDAAPYCNQYKKYKEVAI